MQSRPAEPQRDEAWADDRDKRPLARFYETDVRLGAWTLPPLADCLPPDGAAGHDRREEALSVGLASFLRQSFAGSTGSCAVFFTLAGFESARDWCAPPSCLKELSPRDSVRHSSWPALLGQVEEAPSACFDSNGSGARGATLLGGRYLYAYGTFLSCASALQTPGACRGDSEVLCSH